MLNSYFMFEMIRVVLFSLYENIYYTPPTRHFI